MAALAPSLIRLWPELDWRWPNRDHRTDGWYANPKVRTSYGHNPGHNGYSHAIDVDRDGIDPLWVVNHIDKRERVLWYIIWNRTLYSRTYGWKPRPYTGKNPHTDHMHIEIYQTDFAEQWRGQWGIKPIRGIPTEPDVPGGSGGTGGTYNGDFGPDYGGRDYRGHVVNLGKALDTHGVSVDAFGRLIGSLRR